MRLETVLIRPIPQMKRYCEKCHKKMVEQQAEVKGYLQGKPDETKYIKTTILFCQSDACLYGKICAVDVKQVDEQNRVWIISYEPKLWKLLLKNKRNQEDSNKSTQNKKKKRGGSGNKLFDEYGRFIPTVHSKKKYDWSDDNI